MSWIRVGTTRINLAQVTHVEETEIWPYNLTAEEARAQGKTEPAIRVYLNQIIDGYPNYLEFKGREIGIFWMYFDDVAYD